MKQETKNNIFVKKISNEYREKEEQSQRCLLIIIEYIRVFVRQGLALRGDQTEGNQSDGDHVAEFNSNFHQFDSHQFDPLSGQVLA